MRPEHFVAPLAVDQGAACSQGAQWHILVMGWRPKQPVASQFAGGDRAEQVSGIASRELLPVAGADVAHYQLLPLLLMGLVLSRVTKGGCHRRLEPLTGSKLARDSQ